MDPSNYGYREIGGIPTVVTSDHHYVLPHWEVSGLRDADLLHIDGHHDMCDGPEIRYSKIGHISSLNIGNFICAAVHSGIVSSVYWFNPHALNSHYAFFAPLQYFDSSKLQTMVDDRERISWKMRKNLWIDRPQSEPVKSVAQSEVPLIVDIDLDAFCCRLHLHNMFDDYDGIHNWEDRIEKTMSLLRNIRAPDMITVTRSEGYVSENGQDRLRFVPSDKVDKVQNRLLHGLAKIYERASVLIA
ncbi:MAG: UPF0489 family protein [Candidatus Aenigmarchaeota archaeon]|nr:UPF0489 family protein [Candidatus Aenigmarchaeota archaeon]